MTTGNRGAGGALVIHPKGLSDLTIDLSLTDMYAGITPYAAPLQTLRLNEDKRLAIAYDARGVLASSEPLVPLSFTVIIKTANSYNRLVAYNNLQAALMNAGGGTIEYAPEYAGDSALPTFYHYVQSGPPKILEVEKNRLDSAERTDGMYTLYVDVEFQTLSVATSDPDNLVQVLAQTTIGNTNGYVTIDGDDLLGTMPACIRWLATPATSGMTLGRLIMFDRHDGTLANFISAQLATAATDLSSGVWTNESSHMDCSSGANEIAHGLRFTIANPSDHKGRFAVFGVGLDNLGGGAWTHQVKLSVGNVVQEGESYEATTPRSWQLIYAGEFELPITPLSGEETAYSEGPYLDWYSTSHSGASDFSLLGIWLVYVSDEDRLPTALDVSCGDEGGIAQSASESLLVENLIADGKQTELAHAVKQSGVQFVRALLTAPRGDFLMLKPGEDHRVYFVQERYGGVTVLDDDFTSYKGKTWVPISDMEADEGWTHDDILTDAWRDTTTYVEGASGHRMTKTSAAPIGDPLTIKLTGIASLNLVRGGVFGSSAYVCWSIWTNTVNNLDQLKLNLYKEYNSGYFRYSESDVDTEAGYNFFYKSKSSFIVNDGDDVGLPVPSWSDIRAIEFILTDSDGVDFDYWSVDYLRLEAADPGSGGIVSDVPNATGTAWDFQPAAGVWTITEDCGFATLACLHNEAGVEKTAITTETVPADVDYTARVMAKRDDGMVGITFRVDDDYMSGGDEYCYAALIDTTNNLVILREYANGVPTNLTTAAFTSGPDIWYTIGVTVRGSSISVYVAETAALDNDEDVFDAANLKCSATDATYSSGTCGLMSVGTLGRFTKAKIVNRSDKFYASDQITVKADALFRTLIPFAGD